MMFRFRKHRRFPIRRDHSGKSLRQQAFELFDGGSRPSQIYKQQLVPASPRTLFRYYEDWKTENDRPSRTILKRTTRRGPGLTDESIKELSEQLGIPIDEVMALLTRQPWGILQLLGEHLLGNSPEIVQTLVSDIVLLRDNSILEIRKQHGVISVTTRYRDGKVTQKRLNCKIPTSGSAERPHLRTPRLVTRLP